MWIVAIAWIYVVILMAATEPTVIGGIMTFVFYCAVPLSLLFYLAGAKRRRQRRQLAERDRGTPGNKDAAGAASEAGANRN